MASSISVLASRLSLGTRTFNYRELIPVEQHQLWRIEQGMVRTLTWDDEGTVAALGVWGVGDVLGSALSSVEPYQIECLSTVQASLISHQDGCYTNAVFSHLNQIETLLKISHSKSVGRRLWQLLVWLGQRFGHETEIGQLIDLPMTHQDLAETIGTSRVTVTRMLNALQREGVLQFSHKRYTLLH